MGVPRTSHQARSCILSLVAGIAALTAGSVLAQEKTELSLEQYLSQVRQENLGARSSTLGSEAGFLRSDEGDLITAWTPFFNASFGVDERETVVTAFQGTSTSTNSYSLGIRKLTDFGLQTSLYYGLVYQNVEGVNPQFVPDPAYNTTGLNLELRQPILRDGFGRTVRANKTRIEASALAQGYGQKFVGIQTLAQAEQAYWGLALARELVDATQENLRSAERLRDWAARRVRLNLADRADLLQVEAAVLARKLEVESAKDQLDAAERAFNTARGLDSDEVPERLAKISGDTIERINLPERAGPRANLKSAEQEFRAATAIAKIEEEKSKPELSVFANIALTGRDPVLGDAVSKSVTMNYPNRSVGVNFSVPLDIGTMSRNQKAYALQAESAELRYRQTSFEEERLWKDSVARFTEARERLKLARQMESAQKEKLQAERTRQQRGRTTMFQVITFEQDFVTAQQARIRAQAEVLNLAAQLKTFGGAQ